MSDELVKIQLLMTETTRAFDNICKRSYLCKSKHSHYLVHVLLNDPGNVGFRFVVPKERTLECPLVQKIHGMSPEGIVLSWHTDQHRNTPTLKQKPLDGKCSRPI